MLNSFGKIFLVVLFIGVLEVSGARRGSRGLPDKAHVLLCKKICKKNCTTTACKWECKRKCKQTAPETGKRPVHDAVASESSVDLQRCRFLCPRRCMRDPRCRETCRRGCASRPQRPSRRPGKGGKQRGFQPTRIEFMPVFCKKTCKANCSESFQCETSCMRSCGSRREGIQCRKACKTSLRCVFPQCTTCRTSCLNRISECLRDHCGDVCYQESAYTRRGMLSKACKKCRIRCKKDEPEDEVAPVEEADLGELGVQ